MAVLTVALGVLLVICIWILWKVRREMIELRRQIHFIQEKQSNADLVCDVRFLQIGTFTDELNLVLKQQRLQRQDWKQKEEKIARTYTDLSHDIRTPLTSLDGYFQLLAQTEDEAKQQHYLRIIRERIRALREMLEELFTFTRLESRSYEIKLVRCDLNHQVKETLFSYYEEWEKRGITPELQLIEQPLPVLGTNRVLQRILQNIIKNVMDHGGNNVKIQLDREAGQAVLVIQNHIDHPEDVEIERIFERFYKADPARNKTSTGLGMAITKELVHCLQGEISACLVNQEFCVKIQLPLIETDAGCQKKTS